MPYRLLSTLAPLLALLLAAAPLRADEKPGMDTVVATVNGAEITLGHMLLVRADLPAQYQQLPDDVLFRGILDQLVSQTLLDQSIEGAPPRRVQLALDNKRRSLMAAEAIKALVDEGVTEAVIQQEYEKRFSGDLGREYRAAHILVKTEDEARQLIKMLEDGADFATLAKDKSTGPSGPSGGELGWFGEGQMVPEFETAVKALDVGQVSGPVQTQFGWHVIKLEETRLKKAPPLDEVRADIERDLQEKLVEDRIEALRKQAVIDRSPETAFDPAILKDTSLLEN